MLSLQDRNWLAFSVDEIFTVSRPPSRTKDDYEDGDIPFVASGASGNGVVKFCSPKEGERLDSPGCISVSPVDGSCFYQPISFLGRGGGGSSIMLLRSDALNSRTGIFIARMLAQTLGAKYTYGRMGNAKTILREQFLLPVGMLGEPDWKFMEDYIREREAAQIERCREFLMKRIADIERERERVNCASRNLMSLTEKPWRAYTISTVFDILPGKRLESRNRKPGHRPFIGALDNSNGVAGFVDDENTSLDKNVLGVNYNGNGVCLGFYHPYECIFSDDVKRFRFKSREGTEYSYLFLKVAIQQQKSKFGYLYKFNSMRMARQAIMLPTADDGQPDYTYMEAYGRKVTLGLLEKQLAHIAEQKNL